MGMQRSTGESTGAIEAAPGAAVRPLARRVLATQSDERLVKLLREGHEAAFDEIVGRYQLPLTSFAAAFIPFHRAEDVVQASLLKAHKALLADDREIALRAWLFTIVRNGALNAIRDEPDWQELDPAYDGVPQPPQIAERNEELQALVTAICALPEAQRRALVGRELEGEGHAELAAELGTSSTAIRGLIFRARTALRDALGAIVPLPILRLLLASSSAGSAGATGVGIGLGAGGISAGVKVAAALSTAALLVGSGVAIEHRQSDRARAAEEPAKAEATGGEDAARLASPSGTEAAAAATPANSAAGSDRHEAAGASRGGSASSSSYESGPNGPSTPGSSGSGGGSGGSSNTGGDLSGSQPPPPGSGGSGHGPGPGPAGDGGGAPTGSQPPPTHQGPGGGGPSDDGGSHDGTGSSGSAEDPPDDSPQPPPPPPSGESSHTGPSGEDASDDGAGDRDGTRLGSDITG